MEAINELRSITSIDWNGIFPWLETKEDGEIVGVSSSPLNCPVFNYLKENGILIRTVGVFSYHDMDNLKIMLPKRIVKFIKHVCEYTDRTSISEITKETAIKIWKGM